MKPSEILVDDPAPQRVLIGSREELHQAVGVAIRVSSRMLRFIHRDLSVFNLSSIDATEALSRLLLGSRNARVRLLVDDPAWLDTGAARLRLLQQRFPHALELRVASQDDPVGDDAQVLADDHAALELRPTPAARGDLWLHNKPHAQPRVAAFDRRWEAGAHNLPVTSLGLG
ncbi:MAG: hypothetical protein WBC37_15040 [Burkholderiaceae bacterium]